jgi:hypothetical protein
VHQGKLFQDGRGGHAAQAALRGQPQESSTIHVHMLISA